jgi:hypothetical protein
MNDKGFGIWGLCREVPVKLRPEIFAKSFVTKRDSLRKCSFVPAGSDEPLFPSDIFSSSSAEPAGHEPRV